MALSVFWFNPFITLEYFFEGGGEKKNNSGYFKWKKPILGNGSACISEKVTPLPEPTELAHALIVSPWPSYPSCASQSVYMEKSWPGQEDVHTITNGWPGEEGSPSSRANFSTNVKRKCRWGRDNISPYTRGLKLGVSYSQVYEN